jgi:hypothetical protein
MGDVEPLAGASSSGASNSGSLPRIPAFLISVSLSRNRSKRESRDMSVSLLGFDNQPGEVMAVHTTTAHKSYACQKQRI